MSHKCRNVSLCLMLDVLTLSRQNNEKCIGKRYGCHADNMESFSPPWLLLWCMQIGEFANFCRGFVTEAIQLRLPLDLKNTIDNKSLFYLLILNLGLDLHRKT